MSRGIKGAASAAPSLAENEAIIERGMASFVEVGEALARIHDERQYKADYATFEDYCRERWRFKPNYAYKQIAAAAVCTTVHTALPNAPIPSVESVARELTRLAEAPDEMVEAWKAVVDEHGPKPTARQVRAEVLRRKAPDRVDKPKANRKRGQAPTVEDNGSLALDPQVVSWVRSRTREGWGTKQIITAANAGEKNWPLPGEKLSDGVVTACRAAIYHLETQGAHWPLKTSGGGIRKSGSTRTGKRLHEVGAARAAARRSGDPIVLWDTAFDITKLTGLLQSLDIEDVELDEHGLDVINDLHDDMLFLQDWMDRTVGAVQGRLGEQALRQKIVALRAKTVANGCTVDEEESSQRAADRLERKLVNRLTVVA